MADDYLQKKIGVNYIALVYDVKASTTNWTQFYIKCTRILKDKYNITYKYDEGQDSIFILSLKHSVELKDTFIIQ